MNHIELYLDKFKTIGSTDFLLKKKICETVNTVANIDLQEEDVALHNGVIRLQLSGVRKTEFVLHKEEILTQLKTNLSLL